MALLKRLQNKYVIRILSLVVVIVTWQIVGTSGLINPFFTSYPTQIGAALFDLLFGSKELSIQLAGSIRLLIVGYILGCIGGAILGLLVGLIRTLEYSIDIYLYALYAAPNVAYLPLLLVWFGLGGISNIMLIFLSTFFPVFINTMSGAKNVDKDLVETARSFGARGWNMFSKVVFPATMPWIMTGVRIGVGRAFVAMIVAEFILVITGVGGLLLRLGNRFDMPGVMAIVIVLAVLGVVLTKGIEYLEDKITPWRRGATL